MLTIMRALGDGFRSFVAELKEAWNAMNRGEAPGRALDEAPFIRDEAEEAR